MKNKNVEKEYCEINEATKVVGDFWNIMIIRNLLEGCKRFGEIESSVSDITSSTLSDRLKKLVDEKIIERKQFQSIPPKVEYTLTQKGRDLGKLIDELEAFGNKWYKK